MIKLRSLLKEGEHIKEIFIWMDHDGKITRVPIEGHAPWAAQYLSMTPLRKAPSNVYGAMYDLGWLRVTIMGFMGVNGVHFHTRTGKKPSQAQLDTMIELGKKYNATEIIDDANGGRYMEIW
jgi:hypothetical protein